MKNLDFNKNNFDEYYQQFIKPSQTQETKYKNLPDLISTSIAIRFAFVLIIIVSSFFLFSEQWNNFIDPVKEYLIVNKRGKSFWGNRFWGWVLLFLCFGTIIFYISRFFIFLPLIQIKKSLKNELLPKILGFIDPNLKHETDKSLFEKVKLILEIKTIPYFKYSLTRRGITKIRDIISGKFLNCKIQIFNIVILKNFQFFNIKLFKGHVIIIETLKNLSDKPISFKYNARSKINPDDIASNFQEPLIKENLLNYVSELAKFFNADIACSVSENKLSIVIKDKKAAFLVDTDLPKPYFYEDSMIIAKKLSAILGIKEILSEPK